MKSLFTPGKIVALVVLLAAVAIGLYFFLAPSGAPAAAAGKQAGGRPPTQVTVETVNPQRVRLWTEYSGRMAAIDYAEIRPEVSGRITEVRFKDGQPVKAGDIIIVIDPRPYEAAVEHAKAAIATAQSKVEWSKTDQARSAKLVEAHAVPQSDLDQSNNVQRQAVAELDSGEAQLKTAEVDLDRAFVKAPITGRMSRAEITVGNVVQAGIGAPLLTSIVSQDGIYCDFEVDEQTYLNSIRNNARGNAQEGRIPVQLSVQGDENQVVYKGFIQSFDNRIVASSGTIRARARFENGDSSLVPGMFVTVRLAGADDREAILVPNKAISFDQDKKFVYVVDTANKVSYREVQLGKQVGSNRVVESGLSAGDRVIVDGTQFVRPNDTVAPQEIAASTGLNSDGQVAKTIQP